jgi:hypothetical protein
MKTWNHAMKLRFPLPAVGFRFFSLADPRHQVYKRRAMKTGKVWHKNSKK